jgi:hypothetical protein
MLDGRWVPDTAWIGDEIRTESRHVDDLERRGELVAAADAFAQLALTLRDRPEAHEAQRRARVLDGRADVRGVRQRLSDLASQEVVRAGGLTAAVVALRQTDNRATPDEVIRRLEIPRLKQLETQGDSLERPFARRVLASMSSALGFYEPRRYLELHQPARAVMVLKVAAAIGQWSGQQCEFLVQARALMPVAERASVPVCAELR